ncbi:MAG: hypothetical protein IV090_10835 [Candidatus Sericytochromatia bacterium]|nr:hypothetical protein [Candidatus Sericytochromatia bacterium]
MLFIFSKNKVLNFVFNLLFYLFYLMESNGYMKNALLGLRVFLVSGAVLMMGATSVMSAPQKATQPSDNQILQPIENGALDFDISNATGHSIAGLYISPTGVDSWGPNILPGEFADGASGHVTFSPEAEATDWDMRADWSDDSEEAYVYWTALNLTTINSLTLHYDASTGQTSAEAQ